MVTPAIDQAASGGASTFVQFLREGLLDHCASELNSKFSLPFISKLPSERLPTNQRNLTDARTRIGILLEYSFGLALQDALHHAQSQSRISYVVANRYPDLYIRDSDSRPILRLEVKTLQLISEEKSANFDALVRDVDELRDVIVVITWEWSKNELNGVEVEHPQIRRIFAFEAYPLARARDLGWLNQGPAVLYKAIDVAGPVVGSNETLRREERNMGKLMRILGDEEQGALPEELENHADIERYREFRSFTLSAGLAHNATRILENLGTAQEPTANFVHSNATIQTISKGKFATTDMHLIVAAAGRLTRPALNAYAEHLQETGVDDACIVIFNDKFSWNIYSFHEGRLTPTSKGRKYEGAEEAVRALISQ